MRNLTLNNMFNKKVEKKERELVSCDDCGHVIFKSEAQIIEVESSLYTSQNSYDRFYCKKDQKNYTFAIDRGYNKFSYYKTIPPHRLEVDKNGKEIKSNPK